MVGVQRMWVVLFWTVLNFFFSGLVDGFVLGEQPLSKIAIHRITLGLSNSTSIRASPILLGSNVSIWFLGNSGFSFIQPFSLTSILLLWILQFSYLGFDYRVRILNGWVLILSMIIHPLVTGLGFFLLQTSSNVPIFKLFPLLLGYVWIQKFEGNRKNGRKERKSE